MSIPMSTPSNLEDFLLQGDWDANLGSVDYTLGEVFQSDESIECLLEVLTYGHHTMILELYVREYVHGHSNDGLWVVNDDLRMTNGTRTRTYDDAF